MGDDQRLRKINLEHDVPKLNSMQLSYMRRAEQLNFERAKKFKAHRNSSLKVASVIGLTVLGIYSYTLYAMKQEDFLNDFNEPEKVLIKQSD